MEFDLLLEDESVLAVVPTSNLIEELFELKSRTTLVGKTLGEEMKRTNTTLVSKLKAELAESANSLKAVVRPWRCAKKKCARIRWRQRPFKRSWEQVVPRLRPNETNFWRGKSTRKSGRKRLQQNLRNATRSFCEWMRRYSGKVSGRWSFITVCLPMTLNLKAYGWWEVVMPIGGGDAPRWVAKSHHLRCSALKIRPKDNRRLSSLNTLTEFLYFQNSMCQIHEAWHSSHRRECLEEQDWGVGVSFERNLLKG